MAENDNGNNGEKRRIAISVAILEEKVRLIAEQIKTNLVTKQEFSIVKLLVYAAAGLILSSAFVAILSLIIRKD